MALAAFAQAMQAASGPSRMVGMNFFSPAQIVGYVAFVLGVSSFLQKTDRRLIVFNACQCTAYTIHFLLLGNFTACGSAFVSAVRSTIVLRYRFKALAAIFIGLNIAVGLFAARSPAGWLPVVGCILGTYGLFFLEGVKMRLAFLTSTVLWIANNFLSGSIGGLALESMIFLTNGTTIVRMLVHPSRRAIASPNLKSSAGE